MCPRQSAAASSSASGAARTLTTPLALGELDWAALGSTPCQCFHPVFAVAGCSCSRGWLDGGRETRQEAAVQHRTGMDAAHRPSTQP